MGTAGDMHGTAGDMVETLGKLGGLLLIWLRSSSFSPSEIHGQRSQRGAAPEQHT